MTYSSSGRRHSCREPKLLVKVDLDNVPGGEIHEAEPEAGDEPHADVKDEDGGLGDEVNVNSGDEEPERGEEDAEDGDEAVTQPRGQGGYQGAAAECEEDED